MENITVQIGHDLNFDMLAALKVFSDNQLIAADLSAIAYGSLPNRRSDSIP